MELKQEIPICKCGGYLYWSYPATWGGDHSNYYICNKCGRKVQIYDSQLKWYEDKPRKIEF